MLRFTQRSIVNSVDYVIKFQELTIRKNDLILVEISNIYVGVTVVEIINCTRKLF